MLLNGITCSATVGASGRTTSTPAAAASCRDDYVVVVDCRCRLLNDNWRSWCWFRLIVRGGLISHHLHHHLLLENLLLHRRLLLHHLLRIRLFCLSRRRRHRCHHHHWLLRRHHWLLRRHHWHAHTWLALRCSQILLLRIWCLCYGRSIIHDKWLGCIVLRLISEPF